MDDLFNIAVPNEELEAPAFEIIPTGAYRSTLQGGTEVREANGWKRLYIPFSGFAAMKGDKTFPSRRLEARFPVDGPPGDKNDQSVRIGRSNVVGAASALGLTEAVTGADGKPAQKLVAKSYEELAEEFNSMAGMQVEVYVKAKARERNGQVVLRSDGSGQPVMDNEISNVRALREG